ncbi:MAG: metal-dependent hydrolase [Chitinophagaceae bacterium]|nr:metal-dependent hydrolase [Chitinophagaceae bacterium]
MEFSFYGHSCFSVVVNDKKLLFDPFITGNELAVGIDINCIDADYILLSHGHFDHLADAETIAKRTGATIIANYEIAMWYAGKGIKKYHPMNTGGKWTFDFGTVKCVNAIHSSSLPDGSNGGSPMGFIIINDDMNFYYAGDTALTMDMQLIPQFARIDLAILPVGDNFTMGPEDAVQAAKMVQTKRVIGVHYDTFGFIKIDHQKTIDLFEQHELELKLPAIGTTITL